MYFSGHLSCFILSFWIYDLVCNINLEAILSLLLQLFLLFFSFLSFWNSITHVLYLLQLSHNYWIFYFFSHFSSLPFSFGGFYLIFLNSEILSEAYPVYTKLDKIHSSFLLQCFDLYHLFWFLSYNFTLS